MTSNGYDFIIDRIVNREIKPPVFANMESMNAWMTGYAKCQFDIIDLILKIKEGSAQLP